MDSVDEREGTPKCINSWVFSHHATTAEKVSRPIKLENLPRVSAHRKNPWWTPDLDVLKQQCIDITDTWNSIGWPRSGSIDAERLGATMVSNKECCF